MDTNRCNQCLQRLLAASGAMNQKSLSHPCKKPKLFDGSRRRLNPWSITILVVAGGLSFGWGATAQEYPGCFLETRSGEVVPLPEVCAYPESEPLPEADAIVPSEGGVYQAQIIRRINGSIPVIEALFNNQQSFEMLVDTGASNTVITPIMAEFLGVIPTGRDVANTPSARGVEFDVGLVQSINVAGAVTDNVAVAIAPALDIGLLGQDFFGQYDVTIKEDVVEFRERALPSQPSELPSPPPQSTEQPSE
jgi:aspartyl protease family protein